MRNHVFYNKLQILLILAIMDLKVKYRNSILGYSWSFIRPLLQFVAYYIVFGKILHIGSGINYALQLLLGVLLWAWFADGTNTALHAFVTKKSIVTKICISKPIIILAVFLTSLMNHMLNFILFILLYFVLLPHSMHIMFSDILLYFYAICAISIVIIACGVLLSTLHVFFRDVHPMWELILIYGIFFTPVMYTVNIPDHYAFLYYTCNLLALPIQIMKHLFFTGNSLSFITPTLILSYNTALILLAILSYTVFRKYTKQIADYL